MKKVMKTFLTVCIAGLLLAGCGQEEEIEGVKPIETESSKHQSADESIAIEEAKKVDYSPYGGDYMDSVGQRATATVIANGTENATIMVSWSTSATQRNLWTMHGTLEDGKLKYKDCKLELLEINSEGEEDSIMLYDDGEGFFEIVEEDLLWTGAKEENCRECVFVRVPEE